MTLSPRVLCTNKWSLGRQETVNARIRVAALDEPQSGLSSWLGFRFCCHKASLSRIEARQGNATRLRTAQPEPVAGQRAWCRCSFAISSKPICQPNECASENRKVRVFPWGETFELSGGLNCRGRRLPSTPTCHRAIIIPVSGPRGLRAHGSSSTVLYRVCIKEQDVYPFCPFLLFVKSVTYVESIPTSGSTPTASTILTI